MSVDDSYVKGLKKMKEMGREDTMLNQRKISEDMYKLSVGALFGDIWNRPHLSLRDRQLITMAANVALARPHGTHTHYKSAHHIGISHEEICEVIMHVECMVDGLALRMQQNNTSRYLKKEVIQWLMQSQLEIKLMENNWDYFIDSIIE